MSGQLVDTGKRKRSFGVCSEVQNYSPLQVLYLFQYNLKFVQAPLGSKKCVCHSHGLPTCLVHLHRRGSEGSCSMHLFSGVLGLGLSCRVPLEVACCRFCFGNVLNLVRAVQVLFVKTAEARRHLFSHSQEAQAAVHQAERFEAVARLWTHG